MSALLMDLITKGPVFKMRGVKPGSVLEARCIMNTRPHIDEWRCAAQADTNRQRRDALAAVVQIIEKGKEAVTSHHTQLIKENGSINMLCA